MIKWRSYRFGNLAGILYTFSEAGDALPVHNHKRGLNHNVVVLTGAVEITGPAMPEIRVRAGEIYNVDKEADHTVIALEPGSKTVHFLSEGAPDGYRDGDEGVF